MLNSSLFTPTFHMLSCLITTPGDKISSVCDTQYSWMAVLGLVVYIMGFAPGMGPLPWTINSEIFPNWSRDMAMSITTTTNWICNSIISQVNCTANLHDGTDLRSKNDFKLQNAKAQVMVNGTFQKMNHHNK